MTYTSLETAWVDNKLRHAQRWWNGLCEHRVQPADTWVMVVDHLVQQTSHIECCWSLCDTVMISRLSSWQSQWKLQVILPRKIGIPNVLLRDRVMQVSVGEKKKKTTLREINEKLSMRYDVEWRFTQRFSDYSLITQSLQTLVSFAQKAGLYVDLRRSVWYSSLHIVGLYFIYLLLQGN